VKKQGTEAPLQKKGEPIGTKAVLSGAEALVEVELAV
jgi:hypothetical protein